MIIILKLSKYDPVKTRLILALNADNSETSSVTHICYYAIGCYGIFLRHENGHNSRMNDWAVV